MLQVEKLSNEFIVSFKGAKRLNVLMAVQVKEQLMKFFELDAARVHLNLDGINFIDSAGFEMLRLVNAEAVKANGEFCLLNVNEDVQELIDLLDLNKELVISNK